MPINYADYGPGWRAFSDHIRHGRAQDQCECTGQCGLHQPAPTTRRCQERHHQPAKWAKGRIVLPPPTPANAPHPARTPPTYSQCASAATCGLTAGCTHGTGLKEKPRPAHSATMRTQPLAYDLCCGTGGWTDELLKLGYQVIGVDIHKWPRYAGHFVHADIRQLPEDFCDAAHLIVASPPCTEFSIAKKENRAIAHRPQHSPSVPQTGNLRSSTTCPGERPQRAKMARSRSAPLGPLLPLGRRSTPATAPRTTLERKQQDGIQVTAAPSPHPRRARPRSRTLPSGGRSALKPHPHTPTSQKYGPPNEKAGNTPHFPKTGKT